MLKLCFGSKFSLFFTVMIFSKNTNIGVSECEIGTICGKLSELKSSNVCVVLLGWEIFLVGLKKLGEKKRSGQVSNHA